MKSKRSQNELTVTQLISQEATDNDTKTKTGETGATDRPQLSSRETKLCSPVVKNTATYSEAYACSKNGHKTGPQ